MTHWNIPDNVEELFANLEARYSLTDPEYPGDNNYGMFLFIQNVEGLMECITEDYGTQILVKRGNITLQIDCGGLGDFHLHGFDVTVAGIE